MIRDVPIRAWVVRYLVKTWTGTRAHSTSDRDLDPIRNALDRPLTCGSVTEDPEAGGCAERDISYCVGSALAPVKDDAAVLGGRCWQDRDDFGSEGACPAAGQVNGRPGLGGPVVVLVQSLALAKV
jgi:hypothetical protein